jgi:hydrogenase-4 component E
MISPLIVSFIKILFVLVFFTAALIIMQRTISSLFSIYAAQSLLMAVIAFTLFAENGQPALLALALLTIVSKVILIPYTLYRVQAGVAIKRDIEFRYLTPISSIMVGMALVFFVYYLFHKLLPLPDDNLFGMGAIVGVSLSLIGMMVIFSRKKVITKLIGYLTMENGILLFGLFMAELPFIIELLIIVDLIIFILLAIILAFGIDSSVEVFNDKLNAFTAWLTREIK